MAEKEQASSKEVSEYFYNDPEQGRRCLERFEKEKVANRAKGKDIKIVKERVQPGQRIKKPLITFSNFG